MASVQYLFSHTNDLRIEINEKEIIFDLLSKFRSLCAIIIQKIWRGYSCRQKYSHNRWAIITIQSYYRGWAVRNNMLKYIEEHEADMEALIMNKAATKIQAAYRGYLVRKYMRMHGGTPADRMRRLKEMIERTKSMQDFVRNKFAENAKVLKQSKQDDIKKKILFYMFKWHHLIRTNMRDGVYSCRCSKKLSRLEELMKMFPYKRYMDKIHECYKNAVKNEPPPAYFFESKKLRVVEDMIRNRDTSQDVKPEPFRPPFERFILDPRVFHQYMKCLCADEKYDFKRIEMTHNDEIKELNVSSKPFTIGNFNLDLEDHNLKYFIDFFEKHQCNIHNPPLFDY